MNRVLSIVALMPLAGAVAVAASEPQKKPVVDEVAVDRYIAQLSETVPPPPATRLAKDTPQPKDEDAAKDAARADRAEPVVGVVLGLAR